MVKKIQKIFSLNSPRRAAPVTPAGFSTDYFWVIAGIEVLRTPIGILPTDIKEFSYFYTAVGRVNW
jgi:hypothetical protein